MAKYIHWVCVMVEWIPQASTDGLSKYNNSIYRLVELSLSLSLCLSLSFSFQFSVSASRSEKAVTLLPQSFSHSTILSKTTCIRNLTRTWHVIQSCNASSTINDPASLFYDSIRLLLPVTAPILFLFAA